MVSLIFPSLKDKMKNFYDESKKSQDSHSSSSVHVRRRELDMIVEQESKKRTPNDYWNLWSNVLSEKGFVARTHHQPISVKLAKSVALVKFK